MAFQKGDMGGLLGAGGRREWQCGGTGQLERRKSAPISGFGVWLIETGRKSR
jgi:hypothetical protein